MAQNIKQSGERTKQLEGLISNCKELEEKNKALKKENERLQEIVVELDEKAKKRPINHVLTEEKENMNPVTNKDEEDDEAQPNKIRKSDGCEI